MNLHLPHIIISRTDNLGDVALTLPLCGIIKKYYPDTKVSFLGKAYTKPLIELSEHIDEFLDRDEILSNPSLLDTYKSGAIVFVFPDKEIAKLSLKAGIKYRIGTSHRWFHWFMCNKLVNCSRRDSSLHEAQLNTKLLAPLGIKRSFGFEELIGFYGIKKWEGLPENRVVLHPKSKGSAREWPLKNYFLLSQLLSKQGIEMCVTGTEAEGDKIKAEMPQFFDDSGAKDYTGKFTLQELIVFIEQSKGLVACSTGPLHIAAIKGINTFGFYPSVRPMDKGRWAALGERVHIFALEKNCNECKNTIQCACIQSFEPEKVARVILNSI